MPMDFDEEFDLLMELSELKLARGEPINYHCPYCGMELAPLFERSLPNYDSQDIDWEDQPILCPCCGQSGAF